MQLDSVAQIDWAQRYWPCSVTLLFDALVRLALGCPPLQADLALTSARAKTHRARNNPKTSRRRRRRRSSSRVLQIKATRRGSHHSLDSSGWC